MRTSEKARAHLGDEIYFASNIPYIGGGMNQLRGHIDIHYSVKGTKGTGVMRFVSHRPTPRGVFETAEWSLETPDGKKIDLLEGGDPFRAMIGGDDDLAVFDEEEDKKASAATRGYRQMK